MSRTRLVAAVGIVAGIALAGCTSQGTPGAAPSIVPSSLPSGAPSSLPSGAPSSAPSSGAGTGATPTATPTATPSGPVRCSAAVLTGTMRPKDSAAGNRYAELVVTNTGAVPCSLYGYGGLQLVGPDGAPLPTTALRDEPPKPSLVIVAPGGHAAKLLHWGVVPTGSEPQTGACQPNPTTLRIIPPDETAPFAVTWSLGPVCASGTIHGSGYYEG